MNSAMFTVLISVYLRDKPQLFYKALESIFSSSLMPKCVFLVVDGPVECEIDKIIAEFEGRFDNLHVHRFLHNQGLFSALNFALRNIRTEFVVRFDSDDYNFPDRFEKQIKLLSSGYDLVGGAVLETGNKNKVSYVRSMPLTQASIYQMLPKRNPFNHMTVAFRADFVRSCGGYPNIYLKEDYALWASMISKGARVANTKEILVRASAGEEMYKRRGGLRYVKSEVTLQHHLLKCGVTTLPKAILYGSMRSAIFLIPSRLRGWIYKTFLRLRFHPE
jgi:glycosyltransferase involved in cell wall biosynthesis